MARLILTERCDFFPIPDENCAIIAATCEGFTICREFDVSNPTVVLSKRDGWDLALVFCFPQLSLF